ncbi:hypothetical protein LVW35_14005 [Pseudomonas sp. HN11]|uniref:hypothetical protein n=1 Tax=Pseudomonas sp. HN11 TaxID=1344094 RepID=UPI001F4419D2|nr:hypothetical protein [Pseudomonas sp. HN11]UII74219.1 hypothetical protein LVW35_14005 [Pseudomonas sp. HN11]
MATMLFGNDTGTWDEFAASALNALIIKGDYSLAQAAAKAAEAADQLLLERKARTDAANEYQFGKSASR